MTKGSQGMLLAEKGKPPKHIDAVGSDQAVDVTGAGDTVIAAYALALASGMSYLDAASTANFAGGIVVMKKGTATVSQKELISFIEDHASAERVESVKTS
jgi:bifunctional ADP-heptose synthase (sugar kinase/adenylyltransferase)